MPNRPPVFRQPFAAPLSAIVARPSAASRGYDHRWRKARRAFLDANPVCEQCDRPATVVDHRVPHRGDEARFWDRRNWSALCKPHHDAKTGRGD